MRMLSIGLVGVFMGVPVAVVAHPGGLNAQGCHNDRNNGGYHCHRGNAAPDPRRGLISPRPAAPFPNCDAARAAGAAPVLQGQPGYGRHLDRDGDGIGCEPYIGR